MEQTASVFEMLKIVENLNKMVHKTYNVTRKAVIQPIMYTKMIVISKRMLPTFQVIYPTKLQIIQIHIQS